jgi:hypothetical protein
MGKQGSMAFARFKILTFDVMGTLIDFESGMWAMFARSRPANRRRRPAAQSSRPSGARRRSCSRRRLGLTEILYYINDLILAEGVGFEPTVPSRVQRFSSLTSAISFGVGASAH